MSIHADKIIAVRTNKTVYRDGDRVIKLFDQDFSKSSVLNEALNQSRAEETGLPIPTILEVTKLEGRWAILSTFVKGKTLQQHLAEEPEKQEEYLESFVDLQLKIHEKTAPLLGKLRDKLERKISESDFDATTRYELQTRLHSLPLHKKLCHGDFNPSNVILTPAGEPYILDWSHATQGNASADAAGSYLLFLLSGDLKNADLYLDLFCKKSNTAKQYVQKWLPIVAAAQSVKGTSQEKEFLRKWATAMDYE